MNDMEHADMPIMQINEKDGYILSEFASPELGMMVTKRDKDNPVGIVFKRNETETALNFWADTLGLQGSDRKKEIEKCLRNRDAVANLITFEMFHTYGGQASDMFNNT